MSWMDDLRRLLGIAREEPPAPGAPTRATCQEATDLLFDWLDGELQGEEADRIGNHLETCARCYPRLAFERAFQEGIRRVAERGTVPPDLRARVLDALEREGLTLP